MSDTTASLFDETIQLTNIWLNELSAALDWDDRHRAYRLLRATLHALRDRLPVNEAVDLGAQLPMLVRGLYFEGWHPANKPVKERSREQFLEHIEDAFKTDPNEDNAQVVRAVFGLLANHVSEGEIEQVKHALPQDIRELWPGGAVH